MDGWQIPSLPLLFALGGLGTVSRRFPNSCFVASETTVGLGQRGWGLDSEVENLRLQEKENPWKFYTRCQSGESPCRVTRTVKYNFCMKEQNLR
jgi:hypothetical protein